MLNIQLKCTTDKNISTTDDGYKYSLRVKNYEDLINARDGNYAKTILIVFILPAEEKDWMEVAEDYIKLCKHAFWYFPPDSEKLEKTEFKDPNSTIQIDLTNTNRLGLDFSVIFNSFYEN